MWIFSNKNSVNTTGIKQQLKICVWLNFMLVIVSVGKGRSERMGGGRGGGGGGDVGGWGYTFLKPLDIPQNCVRSLGNSKAKNKDPWKFHINFHKVMQGEIAPNST